MSVTFALVTIVVGVLSFTLAWGLRGKRIGELKDDLALEVSLNKGYRHNYSVLRKKAYVRDGRRFVKYLGD